MFRMMWLFPYRLYLHLRPTFVQEFQTQVTYQVPLIKKPEPSVVGKLPNDVRFYILAGKKVK